MAKQIIWSRLAHQNRIKILEYWIERTKSNNYSKQLNKLFEHTAELISKYPNLGKSTELKNIRYKIVRDYYFTYRETKSRIEILTIWDSRQDPETFDRIISNDPNQ
jgi:toxin YoeB